MVAGLEKDISQNATLKTVCSGGRQNLQDDPVLNNLPMMQHYCYAAQLVFHRKEYIPSDRGSCNKSFNRLGTKTVD